MASRSLCDAIILVVQCRSENTAYIRSWRLSSKMVIPPALIITLASPPTHSFTILLW